MSVKNCDVCGDFAEEVADKEQARELERRHRRLRHDAT